MIPARRWKPNNLIFRYLQLGAALLALAVVAIFLRHSLQATSYSFREDFERQSFLEMSRGETFLVARKLAAMAKSEQVSCLRASKEGVTFFEERKGNCHEGFFRIVERVWEQNHGIEVLLTLQLQRELFWGFFLFVFLQSGLVLGIWITQRRAVIAEHRHDLDLANLARQVGHDLRSPLAVLAYPEVGAQVSARALERLREMVGRLIGETGSVEREIGFSALIEETVAEKKIEFAGRVDIKVGLGATDITVPGGAFLWRRMLSNLLNNSVEASLPAPAEIEITLERTASGGRLEIRDQGRGMPAQILGKLGVRGFSFGKSAGRGLGLSSAFEFMRSLGGAIEIQSREGEGATIVLLFPLFEPAAVLIDDDSQLAVVWRMAAKRRGVNFLHFAHPEEFLKEMGRIARTTAIYIDLSFSEVAFDPEVFIGRLRDAGFEKIYLATGQPKEKFRDWPGLSGVIGKDPPWI